MGCRSKGIIKVILESDKKAGGILLRSVYLLAYLLYGTTALEELEVFLYLTQF